jgi:hypothetical protein
MNTNINWNIGESFDSGSGEEAHVYVDGTPWVWAVRSSGGSWCIMPTESAPAPWYTAILNSHWHSTIDLCLAEVERLVAEGPTTDEAIALQHESTQYMISSVRLY